MAWTTGLTEGTRRGLAREQAWQAADRDRTAAREASEFDRLISQINTNVERKYRASRDAEADRQFQVRQDFLEERAKVGDRQWKTVQDFREKRAKVGDRQWNKEYAIRKTTADEATERHKYWQTRQPELDKMMDAEHGMRMRGMEAEQDHLYGKETWFGKLMPDALESHFPKAWVRGKGYRDQLRELSDQKIQEWNEGAGLRRLQNEAAAARATWEKQDYTYRNSAKGRAELANIRKMEMNLKQSQIDVNEARARAYDREGTQTPSGVKFPTAEQFVQRGRSSHILQTFFNTGRSRRFIFDWMRRDENIAPYEDSKAPTDLRRMIGDLGTSMGAEYRNSLPTNTTLPQLNFAAANLWTGMLQGQIKGTGFGDIGDNPTMSQILLRGIDPQAQTTRMSDARQQFMNNFVSGYISGNSGRGTPPDPEVGDTTRGDLGKIDSSWWTFGKSGNALDAMNPLGPGAFSNTKANLSNLASIWNATGKMNWDYFDKLPYHSRGVIFGAIPAEKREQFRSEWKAYKFPSDRN